MIPGDHHKEPSYDPFDCAPLLKTRQGGAGILFAVDCACGRREHRSITFLADEVKAYASYERRVG